VPAATQWAAFPQPFSPLNWKLIASSGTQHLQAHVNLAGHRPLVPAWPALRPLHDIAAAFRPPAALEWQIRDRFGTHIELRTVAEELWADERFAAFRRFATHPSLSATEPEGGGGVSCVWFTDLRYDLPTLPDTFRYGFSREGPGAPWQLYRLRYFSRDARQRIE
jgi:inner membrane protein